MPLDRPRYVRPRGRRTGSFANRLSLTLPFPRTECSIERGNSSFLPSDKRRWKGLPLIYSGLPDNSNRTWNNFNTARIVAEFQFLYRDLTTIKVSQCFEKNIATKFRQIASGSFLFCASKHQHLFKFLTYIFYNYAIFIYVIHIILIYRCSIWFFYYSSIKLIKRRARRSSNRTVTLKFCKIFTLPSTLVTSSRRKSIYDSHFRFHLLFFQLLLLSSKDYVAPFLFIAS